MYVFSFVNVYIEYVSHSQSSEWAIRSNPSEPFPVMGW